MEYESQLQLALTNNPLTDNRIMEQRSADINHLANEVQQVGELFTDLAILVENQGEQLDNIETNIQDTVYSTDKAKNELIKINKYKMSKRKCRCYLCLICSTFFGIVILWAVLNSSTQ